MAAVPVNDTENSIQANEPPANDEKPKQQRPKRKGRNYAQIHARPVPLEVHPLPAFHPSHPLSLLRLAYTWLAHALFPPSSHCSEPYLGYFSPETRSIHVTNATAIRALWEMGFFGKGTLSRSEPSWLQREMAKCSQGSNGRAAEDATRARREERRLFKLERARLEREKIERQRLVEEGKLDPERPPATVEGGDLNVDDGHTGLPGDHLTEMNDRVMEARVAQMTGAKGYDGAVPIDGGCVADAHLTQDTTTGADDEAKTKSPQEEGVRATNFAEIAGIEEDGAHIEDQEHLQLTLEEAFFLSYGLGVLSILSSDTILSPSPSPKWRPRPYKTQELLPLFCRHSSFPSQSPLTCPAPDDQFLLNYVVYHHFRSLGWVVRPGTKFSVDYLLYNRGPVFSHAEFAVLIMPSYTHQFWNTPGGRSRRRVWEQKDWWWLHCINRVQSQVKKTLVLCYVDIPSPFEVGVEEDQDVDIGRLLRSYKVREFVVKRWIANRSRD